MAEQLTKIEATRRAIAELGRDAKPADIQSHVKKRFGIEMTLAHAKTNKNKILREQGGEAAGKVQPASPPVKVAKNEAVYRAVLALGREASRGLLRDYVKEHFGHEMDLNHVSAARAAALRKMAKAPEPQAQPAVPADGSTVALADILKLRELVNRVGADNLRALVGAITGR
jgi:hypothetical protein